MARRMRGEDCVYEVKDDRRMASGSLKPIGSESLLRPRYVTNDRGFCLNRLRVLKDRVEQRRERLASVA